MIFQTFYDLFMDLLFTGALDVKWVDLMCTIMSTCATVFVAIVPFLIVWYVIKFLFRLIGG